MNDTCCSDINLNPNDEGMSERRPNDIDLGPSDKGITCFSVMECIFILYLFNVVIFKKYSKFIILNYDLLFKFDFSPHTNV